MKQVARALAEQRNALTLPVVTSFWASGDLGESTASWPKSRISVVMKPCDSMALVPFETLEEITMAIPQDPALSAPRVDMEKLVDSLVTQISAVRGRYFSDHADVYRQTFQGVKYTMEIGTTIVAELVWTGAATPKVID